MKEKEREVDVGSNVKPKDMVLKKRLINLWN